MRPNLAELLNGDGAPKWAQSRMEGEDTESNRASLQVLHASRLNPIRDRMTENARRTTGAPANKNIVS